MILKRKCQEDVYIGQRLTMGRPGYCKPYKYPGCFRQLLERLRIISKRRMWGWADENGRKGDVIAMRIQS